MSVSANSNGPECHGTEASASQTNELSPFRAGAIVLLTLGTPREKYWGALLDLNPAGVSVRGISLASLDDCIQQIRAEERVDGSVVFFPMHRVERMELDAHSGDIPSIGERFESKTGIAPSTFFAEGGVQR